MEEMLCKLPDEMMFEISQHLTVKDLVACCAVSCTWRDTFNTDVFWRKWCDIDLVDHLRYTECVVNPGFVSPEVEGSGLSPVCEWRLNYMRQVHLHNNMQLGRHKTSSFPLFESNVVSMFYMNTDLLVTFNVSTPLGQVYKGKLQLWDITNNLVSLSAYDLIPEIPGMCRWMFVPATNSDSGGGCFCALFVYGEQITFRFGFTVQVWTVSDSQLKFKYAFKLFGAEILLDIPVIGTEEVEAVASQGQLELQQAVLIGPIYLAFDVYLNRERKLHVWNVETKEKRIQEMYEDCLFFSICGTETANTGNKVAIIVYQPSTQVRKIIIYDVARFKFLDFCANFYGCEKIQSCVMHGGCIAVLLRCWLKIYNIETNELISSRFIQQDSGPNLPDLERLSPMFALRENVVFSPTKVDERLSLNLFELNSDQQILLESTVRNLKGFFSKIVFFNSYDNDETYKFEELLTASLLPNLKKSFDGHKLFFLKANQCGSKKSVMPCLVPFPSKIHNVNSCCTKFLVSKHMEGTWKPSIVHYW